MIGIDITLISRIKKAVERDGFKQRVFTEREQNYCNGKTKPEQSYAGIFCAKEAAVKAVKHGFFGGIMPSDIEVVHGENGAPELVFHGGAVELFGPYIADLSISHDGDYAVATVLLSPAPRA